MALDTLIDPSGLEPYVHEPLPNREGDSLVSPFQVEVVTGRPGSTTKEVPTPKYLGRAILIGQIKLPGISEHEPGMPVIEFRAPAAQDHVIHLLGAECLWMPTLRPHTRPGHFRLPIMGAVSIYDYARSLPRIHNGNRQLRAA